MMTLIHRVIIKEILLENHGKTVLPKIILLLKIMKLIYKSYYLKKKY